MGPKFFVSGIGALKGSSKGWVNRLYLTKASQGDGRSLCKG